MLRDKEGNRLFRKMTVKIIYPDNIFPEKTYVQHAGAHQGFGPEGIDHMLNEIADKLDTLYPWWDFKPLELSPVGRTTRWVFTFAGYRAIQPATPQPIAASTAPVSETADALTESAIKEAVGNTLQELPSLEQALGDFR